MEINADAFLKIMLKNFDNLKIIETPLGIGIKLNPFRAFIYSSITGAGYLDNPIYPFTPKGLLKLFYNACDYKFVTGIFDNTTLKNTPYILSKAKPFLFNSDKIIIPVEFKSEYELQEKLKVFISKIKDNSTNYIIQRIELSKKGNGMEPFMEYLACEYFRNFDYIVENQIPLSHSTGSPDFGGYKIEGKSFHKIHIIELSLLRLGIEYEIKNIKKSSIIVGEAKTSTKNMTKQLLKYLRTGFFNKGIEIHPNKEKASNKSLGLLTIDNTYKIKYIPPEEENTYLDTTEQKEYIEWLKNYFKFYLLSNLTNDELINFFETVENKKLSSKEDLVDFVKKLTFEDILNKIKEVTYGSFK